MIQLDFDQAVKSVTKPNCKFTLKQVRNFNINWGFENILVRSNFQCHKIAYIDTKSFDFLHTVVCISTDTSGFVQEDISKAFLYSKELSSSEFYKKISVYKDCSLLSSYFDFESDVTGGFERIFKIRRG